MELANINLLSDPFIYLSIASFVARASRDKHSYELLLVVF